MKLHVPLLLTCLCILGFSAGARAQETALRHVGSYYTDVFNQGAAETAAFDRESGRLFFTNSAKHTLGILDISDVGQPQLLKELDLSSYGGRANGVATSRGIIAVALENRDRQQAGSVVFFDAEGNFLNEVTVGAQPDMLVFTHDGSKVLTANEGEPNNDYTIDPEGSVSIIDLGQGVASASARQVGFAAYNSQKAALINRGVRIYGPNATVAQDLEPEYITITPDDKLAYVSLQENNALALIDIDNAVVLDILPLGVKNHAKGEASLREFRLDQTNDWPELGRPVYGGGQPSIKLGGFAGLYFDPVESDDNRYVFYTIPDRGPHEEAIEKSQAIALGDIPPPTNLRPFLLPNYQARIVRFEWNRQNGALAFGKEIMLRRYNPEINDTVVISGRGNVFEIDEIPVTLQDEDTEYKAIDWIDTANEVVYTELGYDSHGGYFGGITRDRDGNFWLCDRYRPSLYKVRPNGALIQRFVPVGTAALVTFPPLPVGIFGLEILPQAYNKRRENRGFSAVAYDPDDHVIYAFVQSPLDNPNPSAAGASDVVRVLGVNADNGTPVSEYVYLLERNHDAGVGLGRVDKIGDAAYLGDGRFAVLENDSSVPADGPGARKFLFEVNINGATNILGTALSHKQTSSGPNDKTLEMMSADELNAAGIVPAHKIKILNLPSLGYLANGKPEGLALLPGGELAVINNNDYGMAGAGHSDLISLGLIAFSDNYGMDASDRDDKINITRQPVYGMYQPDAIASFAHEGQVFLATANEGDAREYTGAPGLVEATRVSGIFLNPGVFGRVDSLQLAANLGRLNVTNTQGDLNGNGLYDQLYSFGARSFSIFDSFGNLLFDSGDDFERITAEQLPRHFNSNHNNNNSFDSRSDDKGPEPEGLAIGMVNGGRYLFVGLERIGGIMVYNIDEPRAPRFVQYLNDRDFGVPVDSRLAGDLGPEALLFIAAADSPNGEPLLITANEVSGTVSIFSFSAPTSAGRQAEEKWPWRVFPNPAGEWLLSNQVSNFEVFNTFGQLLARAVNTDRIDLRHLPAGAYVLRDVERNQSRLFIKR
jgi:hypothetical protein